MGALVGVVSQNAKDFRKLCRKLHRKCSHISYDRVVLELLDSKHGYLMSGASLEDIAYIYDISRQRVQQIENTAMKRIRTPTNVATKLLKDYAKHNSHLTIQIGKDPK